MVDTKKFHFIVPVVVGYGRGTAPILPQRITCHSSHIKMFSDCSIAELDIIQCKHVAGIDCKGIIIVAVSHLGTYIIV